MNKRIKLGLGALVLTMALSMLPASGLAQTGTDPSQAIIPKLDLDQSEIRDSIRALFKGMDLSYSISSDVQGVVTLQMRGKPFETVLQAILRQVDATYRIEGSTYTIVKRQADPIFKGDDATKGLTGPNRVYLTIPIKHADPQVIFLLLQGKTTAGALATLVTLPGEISARTIGGGGFGGNGGGNGGFNNPGSGSIGSPGGGGKSSGGGPPGSVGG